MSKNTKGQKKSAENQRGVKKPQDWEKAVSVAYLRAIGHTQEEAAEGAGSSIRAIREWEKSKWWPKAWEEAKARWLQGAEAHARRGILSAFADKNEYAQMSRWVAERLIVELAPPKLRQEHTGKDGAPLATIVYYHPEKEPIE